MWRGNPTASSACSRESISEMTSSANHWTKQSACARILLCAVVLAGAGCLTLEESAPPAAALVPAGSPVPAPLARGRELYVTACAKCHSAEPVLDYPVDQWINKILPEMNELTKLTPSDAEAVRAYVLAVHAAAGRDR